MHALSYVFAAAFAGRPQAEGAVVYVRWIEAVWSGAVATILPELEDRSKALGAPPQGCAESDPRQLVFEAFLSRDVAKEPQQQRGLAAEIDKRVGVLESDHIAIAQSELAFDLFLDHAIAEALPIFL